MITHMMAKAYCKVYMEGLGYAPVGMLKFKEQAQRAGVDEVGSLFAQALPDLVYYKDGSGYVVAIEVKPPHCKWREIQRGVGQCGVSAIVGFRPYLFIYQGFWTLLKYAAPALGDWLGVMTYDDAGAVQMVKRSSYGNLSRVMIKVDHRGKGRLYLKWIRR